MKLYMPIALLPAFLSFAPSLVASEGGFLRGRARSRSRSPSVICRMILIDTMYIGEEDDDDFTSEEETACAVIVNGTESSHLIPLTLPEDIESAHAMELREGRLLVEITDAQVVDGAISKQPTSLFTVIERGSDHLRHLKQRRLSVTGSMTVAVVRIETPDSSPTASTSDLAAMMDATKTNFRSQFQRCSIGKFEFQPSSHGFVHRVKMPKAASSYGSGTKLVEEASKVLAKNLGLREPSEVADKVMFCVPPGTGNWAASAGMNHWRSQYNNNFCTSLSAVMHELGHSLGLPHSNENGMKYADSTGYMARSYRNKDWPLRCFNGRNSNYLGSYSRKTKRMNGNASPQLIELGSIVHYESAENVLVNLDNGRFFLMYNHATDFNEGTGEWGDSLTVTEDVDGGSELRAGLRPGEQFRYGNTVIEACKRVNDGRSDQMVISVGRGGSRCKEVKAQSHTPKPMAKPISTRTSMNETPFPTVAPVDRQEPSASMSEETPFPTAAPENKQNFGMEGRDTPFPTAAPIVN